MPMQKGMNSSIRWKRQAGELMGGKKNRERFSIKFNENDPGHDAVIRLLEKQGPHSKAQFLVNAVLHYINCPETPDISLPQVAADRASIEEIVLDILSRKENMHQKTNELADAADVKTTKKQSYSNAGNETDREQQEKMDSVTLALIADTMSAFRNN